jgi:3-oxoacyl-[acyl-carrier protein] reductase
MPNFSLFGKNALVCGSTQGIGRAAAIALAELGASVILLARNAQVLAQVREQLPLVGEGQSHAYVVADFSDLETLKKALQAPILQAKKVHILINNTGGPAPNLAHQAEAEAFRAAFEQHLIANHILVQALVEGMKSEGYGRIINVISTSVKQPIYGLGVSNTIRAAVANWAKTLSLELGQFGITVNNLLPGMTETARLEAIIAHNEAKSGRSRAEVVAEMTASIPAARFGKAEEIGAAIAFLASPAAAYINGINLPVDGGRTACL